MKTLILAGLLSAGALIVGCGAIENAVNCNAICNRYKTCYNAAYDTGACETRCRGAANSDPDYSRKADACNGCLDANKDCTSTTFNCGAQCASIVP